MHIISLNCLFLSVTQKYPVNYHMRERKAVHSHNLETRSVSCSEKCGLPQCPACVCLTVWHLHLIRAPRALCLGVCMRVWLLDFVVRNECVKRPEGWTFPYFSHWLLHLWFFSPSIPHSCWRHTASRGFTHRGKTTRFSCVGFICGGQRY